MSVPTRGAWAPTAALVVAAAIWGGSYLAARDLARGVGVGATLVARFVPAALILLGLCALGGRLRALPAATRPGLLLGALRTATIVLETLGVVRTSPTNAGLLIGASVLITPVIESVASRRSPRRALLACVALAAVGIGLLVTGGQGVAGFGDGDALVLGAATVRAVLVFAGSRMPQRTAAGVLELTTVEVGLGALVLTAAGGDAFARAVDGFGPGEFAGALYLSAGCTVVAFLLQLWGTTRTSASHANLVLGTEPLWALLIGIGLAGDRLTATGLVGAVCIVAATLGSRRVAAGRASAGDSTPEPAEPSITTPR